MRERRKTKRNERVKREREERERGEREREGKKYLILGLILNLIIFYFLESIFLNF